MLDEAWVTISDFGYFGLLDVLLCSLHEFSTRPVLVYSVHAAFDATPHPNVVDVRYVSENAHIWTLKMVKMIDAAPRARRLIFLDADTVVNHSIDEMWSTFDVQAAHPELPLLADNPARTNNPVVDRYRRYTGEEIGRPMGCTCLIWYTAACVPFLVEACDFKRRMDSVVPGLGDEEAINVILARRGSTQNVPFCTPLYHTVASYLRREPFARANFGEAPEVYYHLFHGCKNAVEARALLAGIKSVRLPVHYARPGL